MEEINFTKSITSNCSGEGQFCWIENKKIKISNVRKANVKNKVHIRVSCDPLLSTSNSMSSTQKLLAPCKLKQTQSVVKKCIDG